MNYTIYKCGRCGQHVDAIYRISHIRAENVESDLLCQNCLANHKAREVKK